MHTLLIDIGNTRIKWSCSGRAKMSAAVLTHHRKVAFIDSEQWRSITTPAAVYIANVAHQQLFEAIDRYAQRHWCIPATAITAQPFALGVTNGYENPQQLGVDRWLALLAVWSRDATPGFIVDIGSAMTIDVLGQNGVHQGGWIMPGPSAMLSGLVQRTEQIQGFAPSPQGFLAHNTPCAVNNGVMYMIASSIDSLYIKTQQQLGYDLSPIITGGGATPIIPLLETEFKMQSNLVLEGMNRLVSHSGK